MADSKIRSVAKSAFWQPRLPAYEIRKFDGRIRSWLYCDKLPQVQIEYFSDGLALIRRGTDEYAIPIEDFASIERQNDDDFAGRGSSVGFEIDLLNEGKRTPERTIANIGLHSVAVDLKPSKVNGRIFLAALLAMWVAPVLIWFAGHSVLTAIGGGKLGPSWDEIDSAYPRWWVEQYGLGYKFGEYVNKTLLTLGGLSVIGFPILIYFKTKRLHRPPDGSVHYSGAALSHVVLYLKDGQRIVLGSVYGNEGEAIRMRADHVNAFNAAKLAQSETVTNTDSEYL